jgi:hypothetical protein
MALARLAALLDGSPAARGTPAEVRECLHTGAGCHTIHTPHPHFITRC